MAVEPWSMPLADVSSILGSVPFFSGFSKKQLRVVAEGGKEYKYKPGQKIVEEGKAGAGFYLILDGNVEVRKGGRLWATLSKGQFFGEMSVIDEQPRSADVVAIQITHCFTLSTKVFFALIRQHPEIGLLILNELVKRLRAAQA
jgi:CRP/FNR family cyclic AMP-dependent transcriptional regulator